MLACVALLGSTAFAADPAFPLGRTEVMPFAGWIAFDRKLSLEPAVVYGGEIGHTFLMDHPRVVAGMYTRVYGAQTAFLDTDDAVDVINGSAGTSFAVRWGDAVHPYARAGAGFAFLDGTKSGFEVRGRVTYEVALGAKVFPWPWLVLKAEVGALMHDNVPLGAGSGQLGNDRHLFPTLGLGVIR